MGTNNSWNNQILAANVTLNGGTVDIGTDATSGAINIGTGAAARTTTIGNVSGATAVNINTGTGGCAITTTNGTVGLISGTGAINVGADAVAKTVTVGNTTGASALALKCGTGDFSLASASGNIIVAEDTGEVTKPLQPAFAASLSATATDVTGDGTAVSPIVFNSEIFDQSNDFDTGTGIFTAPVTGKYHLSGTISFLQLGVAHTTLLIQIGTSNNTNQQAVNINPSSILIGTGLNLPYSRLVDMDAGDTAQVNVIVSGSTKTVDLQGTNGLRYTCFTGFLAC